MENLKRKSNDRNRPKGRGSGESETEGHEKKCNVWINEIKSHHLVLRFCKFEIIITIHCDFKSLNAKHAKPFFLQSYSKSSQIFISRFPFYFEANQKKKKNAEANNGYKKFDIDRGGKFGW